MIIDEMNRRIRDQNAANPQTTKSCSFATKIMVFCIFPLVLLLLYYIACNHHNETVLLQKSSVIEQQQIVISEHEAQTTTLHATLDSTNIALEAQSATLNATKIALETQKKITDQFKHSVSDLENVQRTFIGTKHALETSRNQLSKCKEAGIWERDVIHSKDKEIVLLKEQLNAVQADAERHVMTEPQRDVVLLICVLFVIFLIIFAMMCCFCCKMKKENGDLSIQNEKQNQEWDLLLTKLEAFDEEQNVIDDKRTEMEKADAIIQQIQQKMQELSEEIERRAVADRDEDNEKVDEITPMNESDCSQCQRTKRVLVQRVREAPFVEGDGKPKSDLSDAQQKLCDNQRQIDDLKQENGKQRQDLGRQKKEIKKMKEEGKDMEQERKKKSKRSRKRFGAEINTSSSSRKRIKTPSHGALVTSSRDNRCSLEIRRNDIEKIEPNTKCKKQNVHHNVKICSAKHEPIAKRTRTSSRKIVSINLVDSDDSDDESPQMIDEYQMRDFGALSWKFLEENVQRNLLRLGIFPKDWFALVIGERMLNDTHINAAHKLIKRQHPLMGGCQSTQLIKNKSFQLVHGEGVQVLHCGEFMHWVAIARQSTNVAVQIFDSLFISLNKNLTGAVKIGVAQSFREVGAESVQFAYKSVQQQSGGTACGLFAIAFMISLVNGTDPTKMQYDQKAMRQHYINCLLRNHLSEFPTNSDHSVISTRFCNEISGEYPVLK